MIHDPPAGPHPWRNVVLGCAVVIVCSGLILLGLRWAALEMMDRVFGTHTYGSTDGARSMAESMGLILVDGDNVVYGEVTSSFPDSSAYLVIATPSADRSHQMLERSGLPRSAPVAPDRDLRPQRDHGPPPSPTLVRSSRWDSRGYLIVTWDPVRAPQTLYVSALQT